MNTSIQNHRYAFLNSPIVGKTVTLIAAASIALFVSQVLLWSTQAGGDPRGDDPLDGEQVNFNFGDNCGRIQSLSDESFYDLLKLKNRSHWNKFCAVGSPDQCDDFSYLVSEFGTFVPSFDDGDICRFVPLLDLDKWIPDLYRNYGQTQSLLHAEIAMGAVMK